MKLDIEFADGCVGATAQTVRNVGERPPEPLPSRVPRHGSRASREQLWQLRPGKPVRVSTVLATPRRAQSGDLFGHPRGLSYLFTTEMWERFSYYGMRALLVLYMVKYLFEPERAQSVIGLCRAQERHWNSLFGPLDAQPLSSHIYGFYTGLVYLTPVFGGLLADRWLGQRRTVVLGAALMAIGHFMMAFEPLFLFALTVLILGNGAFKPNISTQVGFLYAPGDPRRDRAFSIFYVGINLGAFLAPLVCGTLGESSAGTTASPPPASA